MNKETKKSSLLKTIDENLERWFLLYFYIVIVFVIIMEVIRRFVFSYSSVYGEEIARYAFIYLVWIGASLAIKNRSHIRIDALFRVSSMRVKIILNLISDFLALFLAIYIFILSFEPFLISIKFNSVTDGLRISQAWFLVAIPFSFALILFRILQSLFIDIRNMIQGKEVNVESKGIVD